MIHVALLKPRYADLVLMGLKTIELRLLRTRQPPYQRVAERDTLFIKRVAGPFAARCRAARVLHLADLSPAVLAELRERHNARILAPDAFWRERRDARYATLIWLDRVTPTDRGPAIPPMHGRAWLPLDRRDHTRPAGHRVA